MNRTLLTALACLSVLTAPAMSSAADKPKKAPKPVVAASIDDFVVTEEMLSYLQAATRAQTQSSADTPRSQLIERIVTFYLLAKEYDRLELDKDDFEVWLQVASAKSNALVSREVKVTEKEIEKLYAEQYKDEAVKSFENMEYNTRHILVESEEEALGIIGQIEGGADFAELARERSTDKGSGSKGGELGWYSPKALVPPYSEAMQSLEVGEMTDKPVKSQFGWHIIELIEEPRKSPLPTLGEKSQELRNEIFQTRLLEYVDKLKKKADIDIKPAKDLE